MRVFVKGYVVVLTEQEIEYCNKIAMQRKLITPMLGGRMIMPETNLYGEVDRLGCYGEYAFRKLIGADLTLPLYTDMKDISADRPDVIHKGITYDVKCTEWYPPYLKVPYQKVSKVDYYVVMHVALPVVTFGGMLDYNEAIKPERLFSSWANPCYLTKDHELKDLPIE